MDIAIAQGRALQHAELIVQKVRVVAGAVEMPVPCGAFLATRKLTQFLTAQYGSVSEAKARLGGLPQIKEAFRKMQTQLYAS